MKRYFIDSHAWIEYLNGSKAGERVNDLIESGNEIFTLELNIAEVVSKVRRMKGDYRLAYKAIMSNATIINLSPGFANDAGFFHSEMKKKNRSFGLIDAFIYVAGKHTKAKIVTGDNHFKNLDNVEFLD